MSLLNQESSNHPIIYTKYDKKALTCQVVHNLWPIDGFHDVGFCLLRVVSMVVGLSIFLRFNQIETAFLWNLPFPRRDNHYTAHYGNLVAIGDDDMDVLGLVLAALADQPKLVLFSWISSGMARP